MTNLEKEAFERYEQLKADIKRSTAFVKKETPTEKEKRIEKLKGDPIAFCKYYFPMYFDPEEGGSEFGWFQKKALKDIFIDDDYYGVWEFPREHAKSVLATIFVPMFLKANKKVSGCVLCNQKFEGAKGLLSSLQAELESNQLYIADYGEQYSHGEWSSGRFSTKDGITFWAIGKGQSPRGIRKQNKRPNLLITDDFDDDEEVKNEERVDESLRWLTGALYGAIAINQRRIVMVGNRIHLRSCLAQIVGDIGEGDKKNESVKHIKVFALENPKTHEKDESERGVPAWKERYTRERFVNVIFKQMGYFMTQREYFHNPIIEGNRFKNHMFLFRPVPYDLKGFVVVTYLDPSYKDGKKNDFKGLVAVGKIWNEAAGVWNWYLLDVWVRRESFVAMVKAHYEMVFALKERRALPYNLIEGNGGQADLRVHYITESPKYKEPMVPTPDMRDKPEKKGRIDELLVYFENGLFFIDERLRDSPDFYEWKDQFLSHPYGHDDAPDATEGGICILNQKSAGHQAISSGGATRTHQTRGVMVNRERGYGRR
jgi:hypothetical protein